MEGGHGRCQCTCALNERCACVENEDFSQQARSSYGKLPSTMIRSKIGFQRICQVSSAIPQQPLYSLQVQSLAHIGVPGERHGGRARVLIVVTAILREAGALAGPVFVELGERQWYPGFLGSST